MYAVNKKQVGCQAAIAGKPAPTGKNTHGSQSGRLAASFWLLLWIFLPHREAERRFCAVGNPAWMPG
jgi:hypothetical protein